MTDDTTGRRLELARELLEHPTAPLLEDLPRAHVHAVAAAAGLDADDDPAGNVVVRYEGAGADGGTPLVLVAHLDHPGFAVDEVDGDGVSLSFRGGLAAEHARPGTTLHLFEVGSREPVGTAELVEARDTGGRLAGATARVTGGRVAHGGFAMWGFPGWWLDGGRIAGRVCDDLMGAAAALAVLDELARRRPEGVAVWGLFTRAEEMGFLGAFEAIRHRVVPRGAAVLSLECSKALVEAPQGGGVIVRVGDRMSVFDPGLTGALAAAAAERAAADPAFRWQRKLMDGGACEATAFCATGYRSSGLALPLGNYHNGAHDDDGTPTIGPEHVMVDDYLAEVDLLVELALRPDLLAPSEGPPSWLAERQAAAQAALGG